MTHIPQQWLFRYACLSVLTVCVLLLPLASTAGQLHELMSVHDSADAHHDHSDQAVTGQAHEVPVSADHGHHSDGSGPGSWSHLLLHEAACCGSMAASLSASNHIEPDPLQLDLNPPIVLGIPAEKPLSLFRPPILT
jgi:hypothetical protein